MIRPLFITGCGAVSAIAPTWKGTWEALLAGHYSSAPFAESGIELVLDARVGVATRGSRHLEGVFLSEGSSVRLAASACREAIQGDGPRRALALYGGSTHGESDVLLSLVMAQHRGEKLDCEEALWRSLLYDSVAAQLGYNIFNEPPHASWLYSSCTSSMHALLAAAMDMTDGTAEADALVVGVDALSAVGVAGFLRAGAATRARCIPFAVMRDGTLVSEGAAAMILSHQPLEGAQNVCLLSLGLSCDAGHPTHPDPNGEGLERAFRCALEGAGLEPEEIVGLVLHGTGTPANDIVEAGVCRRVFGSRQVPATSVKGAIGHTLGAAGLFNCLIAFQAGCEGLLPRTYSDVNVESLPDIDLITGSSRAIPLGGPILVNCSGFGGNNVVAVFGSKKE